MVSRGRSFMFSLGGRTHVKNVKTFLVPALFRHLSVPKSDEQAAATQRRPLKKRTSCREINLVGGTEFAVAKRETCPPTGPRPLSKERAQVAGR